MANQEEVSKVNIYSVVGPSAANTESMTKIVIYAIVNNSTPPPPPSPYVIQQMDVFTGASNSTPPVF